MAGLKIIRTSGLNSSEARRIENAIRRWCKLQLTNMSQVITLTGE